MLKCLMSWVPRNFLLLLEGACRPPKYRRLQKIYSVPAVGQEPSGRKTRCLHVVRMPLRLRSGKKVPSKTDEGNAFEAPTSPLVQPEPCCSRSADVRRTSS